MKKKMFVLLVSALMLAGMVGCGTEQKQPAPDSTTQQTTTVENEQVSSEFKEAMDTYEEYFDEYIAFMKKYNENPADATLLTEYTEFMSSYSETMEKMEKLGETEMTAAEAAYYLEVTTRIAEKLQQIVS